MILAREGMSLFTVVAIIPVAAGLSASPQEEHLARKTLLRHVVDLRGRMPGTRRRRRLEYACSTRGRCCPERR